MVQPSFFSTGRPLRVLVVDDNHINLSVLSTLLKRKFGHVIDGAPTTVDSGLKAIQLLRTHIFDCILMDIQMPFLSGLEASRRIRRSEDGILPANANAHIVAVTTAVGPEPELAYRRAKMDGMIGKPVRFPQLQQYLCPLAHEAHVASRTVSPIVLDGESVMPPLPPAPQHERVFYLPAGATPPSSRPDICEGSDFEALLNAQTRTSLRRCGSMAIARTGSLSGATHCPISHHAAPDLDQVQEVQSTASSRSNSSSSVEPMTQSANATTLPRKLIRSPTTSMIINRRTFRNQIAREVAKADFDERLTESIDPSDSSASSTMPSVPSPLDKNTLTIRNAYANRPPVYHRTSSPAWLLPDEVTSPSAAPEHHKRTTPVRPKLSTSGVVNRSEGSNSSTSESSDAKEDLFVFSPPLRRESQLSSTSSASDASSTITTPAGDEPAPFWSPDGDSDSVSAHERVRKRSLSTVSPYDSDGSLYKPKEAWSLDSENVLSSSSSYSIRRKMTSYFEGGQCDSRSNSLSSSPAKQNTLGRKRNLGAREAEELAHSILQMDLSHS